MPSWATYIHCLASTWDHHIPNSYGHSHDPSSLFSWTPKTCLSSPTTPTSSTTPSPPPPQRTTPPPAMAAPASMWWLSAVPAAPLHLEVLAIPPSPPLPTFLIPRLQRILELATTMSGRYLYSLWSVIAGALTRQVNESRHRLFRIFDVLEILQYSWVLFFTCTR